MESLKSSKNKQKKEAIDRLGVAGGEEGEEEEEEASLLTKGSILDRRTHGIKTGFLWMLSLS